MIGTVDYAQDLELVRAVFEALYPLNRLLFKQRWGELIKKAYKADPLLCQRCGGAMRIIAFIDQPDVIEKILTHLSLWPYASHAPPPGVVA